MHVVCVCVRVRKVFLNITNKKKNSGSIAGAFQIGLCD